MITIIILAVLVTFNMVGNMYVIHDMKEEGWVTWDYYVHESQSTAIGRVLMSIYYWVPAIFLA